MRRTVSAGGFRVGTVLLSLALGAAACAPAPGGDAGDARAEDAGPDAPMRDAGRDERPDEGSDEGPDEGDEGSVYTLQVTPPVAIMSVGASEELTAVATDQHGRTRDVTGEATWSSSDPTIAAVTSPGQVNLVGPGTAQITATWAGLSAESAVTAVRENHLLGIAIDPPEVTIAGGSSQRFTVTATYVDGHTADVTSMATFSLDNANATLGTGADASLVTARMPGTTVLTARIGSLSSTAHISVPGGRRSIQIEPGTAVIPEGESVRFHAFTTTATGESVELTDGVMWSSGTAATASVDPVTGVVTGVAASAMPVTITATWMPDGGMPVSATATILVTEGTPTLLSATLEPAGSLPLGGSAQVRVQGTYASGLTRDLTAAPGVTYTSSSTATATVSPTGQVSGVGGGSATVTVTYRGRTATVPVTVVADGVARLELAPRDGASPALAVGAARALALTAVLTDGTSRELTNDPDVVFSSSDRDVARVTNSVDAPGVVSGRASGTAVITATYTSGGVSRTASLTVTVRGECVDALALELGAGSGLSIRPDESVLLTPFAAGPSGARRELTGDVVYESSDAFSAEVHNATTGNRARGLVRASSPFTPGPVTVTARYTGADRCVARTAPPSDVQNFTVTTGNPTHFLTVRCTRVDPATGAPRALVGGRLVRGQRAQCAAFARSYADGSETPLSTPTWRATGSGTITPSGVATAGASAGTLSIEAQSGSSIGTLNIPVPDGGAPALSISARPALPTAGAALRINQGIRTQLVGIASYTYTAGGASVAESYDVSELADWSTSHPARVDVSNATNTRGRATGGSEAGDSDVAIAFGGARAGLVVQNSAFALRSVRAAFGSLDGPNELVLRAGERADLFARGEYCPAGVASGDSTCVTWDASPIATFTAANTAVAAIETSGLRPRVRGVAGDSTVVRATVGAITAEANLVVGPACITAIALGAGTVRAIAAGADGAESSSHGFTVTATRGDGSTVVLTDPANLLWRDVTLRRSSTGPASWPETITAERYFTGRFPAAGVGSYRAEYAGAHCATGTLTSASSQPVVARAGALTGVSVAPRAPAAGSVAAGSVAQFRATGTYSVDGGGTLTADITAHDRVSWSASDLTIATNAGLAPGSFMGLRAGSTQVSARLGALVGTNILVVF